MSSTTEMSGLSAAGQLNEILEKAGQIGRDSRLDAINLLWRALKTEEILSKAENEGAEILLRRGDKFKRLVRRTK